MQDSVGKYLNVASVSALKREVLFARKQVIDGKSIVTQLKDQPYDIEFEVFLQIIDRTAAEQRVRIHLITRNSGWFKSISITPPGKEILERWENSPTAEQIQKMIFKTKVEKYTPYPLKLSPQQASLSQADFVMPFPMDVNFSISISTGEESADGLEGKSVNITANMKKDDLNLLRVTP